MRAILIYTRNKTKKKKAPLFSRSRSFTKLKIICCKQNSSKGRLDYFIKIFCYVKENFTIFHCSFFTAPPRPSDFFCAGSLSILNENKIQTTATKRKKNATKIASFYFPLLLFWWVGCGWRNTCTAQVGVALLWKLLLNAMLGQLDIFFPLHTFKRKISLGAHYPSVRSFI